MKLLMTAASHVAFRKVDSDHIHRILVRHH
jgi:hypothetical protein